MLNKVMNELDIKEKELIPFELEDPFNPGNLVKGFISKRSDNRYGALAITHVNGEEAFQIIYATPKQKYPFDKNGKYRFPEAEKIEVYEKLDGTNVLAFNYQAAGKTFQSYKLRLSPFVRNSRFGNFLDMWQELLLRYPGLDGICQANGCSLSFELYGSRNIHLVRYRTSLDTALLFGVSPGGELLSPSCLSDTRGLPTPTLLAEIRTREELEVEYNRLRKEMEAKNSKDEEGIITGTEGGVWYLLDTLGETRQFKCKPESVEQVHWSAGGIGINTIKATAHNVLETESEITLEATMELLREEFSQEQLDVSRPRIEKVVSEMRAHYRLQGEVMERYLALGVSIKENKGAVMREMAKHFPKGDVRRVFTIISNSGK